MNLWPLPVSARKAEQISRPSAAGIERRAVIDAMRHHLSRGLEQGVMGHVQRGPAVANGAAQRGGAAPRAARLRCA
jgi:hypothetical protein